MSTVTLGLKVDEALRSRIKAAATQQGRTPHWLIKQAVLQYVDQIERGLLPLGASGASAGDDGDAAGVFFVAQPFD